jgi:hypothetical protein
MYGTDKIRNLSVEDLRRLAEEFESKRRILESLNINYANYGARKILTKRLKENKIYVKDAYGQKWSRYSKQDLTDAVKNCLCILDVVRKLGLVESSNNSRTIRKLIKEYDIDTSHFDVKSTYVRNSKKYSIEEAFVENSLVNRSYLKRKIEKEKILDKVCGKCGNKGEWLGEPLVLQLDHINGVSNDNRIENLRYLCPNCHTQTENYAGKNRSKR